MEKNIIIDTTTEDRISQLPEPVIHHILSFLVSPADLVRSSVLSKKWFTLTASFPILDFTLRRFIKPINSSGLDIVDILSHIDIADMLSRIDSLSGIPFDFFKDSLDVKSKFWKYVAYTLCRFCKENVSVHTIRLVTMIQVSGEADVIDRCIELSIKKGVRVLDIDIFNHLPVQPPLLTYCLPNVLLSASSLTSLSIRNCEFPSPLMTDAVKLKSLKTLLLGRIRIDEEVIKHLTASCPLLERFNLHRCYGFKRVCIKGLRNLQKVWIDYLSEVERIDIEAPNLSHLILMDWGGIGAPSMDLTSCKKLTTFCFCGMFSPNSKGFVDFLTNFPFVENLVLTTPEHYNNFKLSSNSLRTLVLHSQCDLDEIEINTPNLLLFKYSCHTFLSEPLVRNFAESKPQLECYPYEDVDTIWFQKLRRFLDKKNGFKVLKLKITATSIDVKELKVIPSYELEHVELELYNIKESSVYVAVVDAVLWCCRPQSLTLVSDYSSIDLEEWNHVVKLTHEKLLQQEDHLGRSNIQVVLSSSSKAKMHFNDLDPLLTALSRDQPRQKITFIKEQVVQETRCLESICQRSADVEIA